MNGDTASSLPLHAQLEDALLKRIRDGELRPGTRLPSEDELSALYSVSRTTVRTAIRSLVGRGVVGIRRGKGTFVTEPLITQELTALTGFIDDMRAMGKELSAKVLDRRLVAASETVARRLALQRGVMVARIQRVRLTADLPLSFDETYLPRETGEKLTAEDLENPIVFKLLEQKHSTALREAEYRLAAVPSHGTVARALGIDAGSPIFLIERTIFAEGHRPVNYERLYYRGDHIRLVTRLVHRQSAGFSGTDS
jgi:GntR family transcriptional regulator